MSRFTRQLGSALRGATVGADAVSRAMQRRSEQTKQQIGAKMAIREHKQGMAKGEEELKLLREETEPGNVDLRRRRRVAETSATEAGARGAAAQADVSEAERDYATNPDTIRNRYHLDSLKVLGAAWDVKNGKLNHELLEAQIANEYSGGLDDKTRAALTVMETYLQTAVAGLGPAWAQGIDPHIAKDSVRAIGTHLYPKALEWTKKSMDSGKLKLPDFIAPEAYAMMAATQAYEQNVAPIAKQLLEEGDNGFWSQVGGFFAGAIGDAGDAMQRSWEAGPRSGSYYGIGGWDLTAGRTFVNPAVEEAYDLNAAAEAGNMDVFIDGAPER